MTLWLCLVWGGLGGGERTFLHGELFQAPREMGTEASGQEEFEQTLLRYTSGELVAVIVSVAFGEQIQVRVEMLAAHWRLGW